MMLSYQCFDVGVSRERERHSILKILSLLSLNPCSYLNVRLAADVTKTT
jgi:hypothetical protein